MQIDHADLLRMHIETLKHEGGEEKGGMGYNESGVVVSALQELEDIISDVDQAR